MIPYAFAKTHGVVVSAVGAAGAEVAVREGATAERYQQMLGEQEKSQAPAHPVRPDGTAPKPPPPASYRPETVW